MKIKFQLLLIIPLVFACTPSRITTTNLHDLASFETEGEIIALPKTRLIVTVEAIKTEFTPGPYYQFAKKYLGVDGAASSAKTYWDINNVEISTMVEPDPDLFYSIKEQGTGCLQDYLVNLQKDGFILFPNEIRSHQVFYNDVIEPIEEIGNSNLTITPFNKQPRVVAHSNENESEYRRLPISIKDINLKSDDLKAKAAAAFIFKVRKRRFKMLSGQYEVYPQGVALEKSIRELNKIEEEYLALFIGESKTDTIQRVFSITPESKEILQRLTLFRFSEETGFVATGGNQGIPIVVEVTDLQKTQVIDQLQLPVSASSYTDIIFYRIPDKAQVKVLYGSHVLHESEMSVNQLGALVPKHVSPQSKTIR